ncbi:MAG: class I SAM-dependent methyltransferase [Alphaproteobacteria bacterium]|nr:class I SAM-dependent methyltransferase [Alphaproteobacteria bacterium]
MGELVEKSCAICGSGSFLDVAEVDRYGFYYPTGLCRDCGNLQQRMYYSNEDLDLLYSEYYRDIYGEVSPSELFSIQYAKSRRIYDFLTNDVSKGGRVLEVGCGSGGILKFFQDRGFEVEGCDLDTRYIKYGRTRGISIACQDIDGMATSNEFDLIILSHVLEHLINPRRALEKLKSMLSKEGMIYIEVPSIHIVRSNYQSNLLAYFQNAHFLHFSEGTLENLVGSAGLVTIQSSKFVQLLCKSGTKKHGISNQFDKMNAELKKIERSYRAFGSMYKCRDIGRAAAVNLITKLGMKSAIRKLFELARGCRSCRRV